MTQQEINVLQSNFSKMRYDKLIQSRKLLNRIKTKFNKLETHHIIMKSMGGSNDLENLVNLTTREHYIAHRLLWVIHQIDENVENRYSTAHAFRLMSLRNKKWSSRIYEALRENLRFSEKTIEKLRELHKKRKFLGEYSPHSEETKKKISDSMLNNRNCVGFKHSEETKLKMSESRKSHESWNKGKKIPFKPRPWMKGKKFKKKGKLE